MKNFITLQDLVDPKKTIALAKSCKQDPFAHAHLGQRKTIGLLLSLIHISEPTRPY